MGSTLLLGLASLDESFLFFRQAYALSWIVWGEAMGEMSLRGMEISSTVHMYMMYAVLFLGWVY